MTMKNPNLDKFKEIMGKVCNEANYPVRILETKFENEIGIQLTAYSQTIKNVDNTLDFFMLDAGGNFWYNYQCVGPDFKY